MFCSWLSNCRGERQVIVGCSAEPQLAESVAAVARFGPKTMALVPSPLSRRVEAAAMVSSVATRSAEIMMPQQKACDRGGGAEGVSSGIVRLEAGDLDYVYLFTVCTYSIVVLWLKIGKFANALC